MTDRDALRALVDAIERVDRHSPNARYSGTVIPAALYRARLHLDGTTCSCGTPGLTYDGPVVDCDVHGSPSAAFAAGRREGAQDERDQARIRGDLCRWCLREPQRGEQHGASVPGGFGQDPEVVCLDANGAPVLHSLTDPSPWGGEDPGDPWAQLARDSARRERAAYAAGRAAGAEAHP